jgi:hypothetical protein
MAEPIQDKIKRSLQAAEGLYHRLVLLVGDTGSGKTRVLREVAQDLGTKVINVNLALSAELLELTAKQRALRLPGILDQIVDKEQSPVVLDNIEILFDKDLEQDPLRLLQGISRNRSVVASWNGTTVGSKLIYAETGHPEYRSYDLVDLTIVGMDGMATVDSAQIGRIADLDEPRSGSPAGGQARDGLSSINNRGAGQA